MWPTFRALAKAKTADVLRAWQGLGYNRRAIALQKLAQIVVKDYGGKLPADREKLELLPGIGHGTSGSLMAFVFNEPVVFIETNIRRVFIHHFFPNRRKVEDAKIEPLIKRTLPFPKGADRLASGVILAKARIHADKSGSVDPLLRGGDAKDRQQAREWYWALMDYGTMLGEKSRAEPRTNPNLQSRHYVRQSKFAGSDRELRGAILRTCLQKKRASVVTLTRFLGKPSGRIRAICARLHSEGFLVSKGGYFQITEK
jgi:A/G-specific adenine glycosylase